MKSVALLVCVGLLTACGGTQPAPSRPTPAAAGGSPTPTPTPVAISDPSTPTTRQFTILEPADGTIVGQSPITVRGHAPPGARIVRDISLAPDDEVTTDGSGNWSMSIQLREGANRLVFRVGDDRSTERRLSVNLAAAAGAPTPTPRGYVTAAQFGDAWPLTVPAGLLTCQNSAVFFQAEGRLYTVNGMAITWHPDLPEIDEIWADDPDPYIPKKNIGPLINAGLELCE